jgi:hypothetical protein
MWASMAKGPRVVALAPQIQSDKATQGDANHFTMPSLLTERKQSLDQANAYHEITNR